MAVPATAGCAQRWAPVCRCRGWTPTGCFLPCCPHHTHPQCGAAGTPPPRSPGTGLWAGELCPLLQQVWSRPGQGTRRAATSPSAGKCVRAMHRCVTLPCTPLCPLPVCPSNPTTRGRPWGRTSPPRGPNGGKPWDSPSDSGPESQQTPPWRPLDGAGKGPQGPGTHPDGSLYSRAALLNAAAEWAQAAPLTRRLSRAAARFHFSGLRPAWMSLIAQRSSSPSPGPRVRGTPGRNLTRTQVIRDQRWGPGNCNGHQPKYAVRPPR